MNEHEEKIARACAMLHAHFEEEAHDYSEREDSDVEYFVGVIMYNLFAFSKAIPTMKTMDVGSDFAHAAGKTYVEACELIDTIKSGDETELLALLQNHTLRALEKYSSDPGACYLLKRLKNHIDTLAAIYAGEVSAQNVNFNRNPLSRI